MLRRRLAEPGTGHTGESDSETSHCLEYAVER